MGKRVSERVSEWASGREGERVGKRVSEWCAAYVTWVKRKVGERVGEWVRG